ncbi:unnamed protein product [Soboliphyme baturini]|uniref:TFIIB domain-containing protein n=1 Tax=Soboliphyme baturini TaxID=241478 RepID=A0A183J311_9BILA|nr:unnamed protein product [Soboliphyme baturini]
MKILEDEEYFDKNEVVWTEHVPTACARVDSLRTHGHKAQAVRLALAIVRNMKKEQQKALTCLNIPKYADEDGSLDLRHTVSDGWIGHPLDPVNCIVDCLISASEANGSRCLKSAVQAALISLSQRRRTPPCLYAQQKAIKQEEVLVNKLKSLDYDDYLLQCLKEQAHLILNTPYHCLDFEENFTDSRKASNTVSGYSSLHSLASFMFQIFLPQDPEMAYRIGLKAVQ